MLRVFRECAAWILHLSQENLILPTAVRLLGLEFIPLKIRGLLDELEIYEIYGDSSASKQDSDVLGMQKLLHQSAIFCPSKIVIADQQCVCECT